MLWPRAIHHKVISCCIKEICALIHNFVYNIKGVFCTIISLKSNGTGYERFLFINLSCSHLSAPTLLLCKWFTLNVFLQKCHEKLGSKWQKLIATQKPSLKDFAKSNHSAASFLLQVNLRNASNLIFQ